MRPAERFLSELDALARDGRVRPGDPAVQSRLRSGFLGLAAPIVGPSVAEDIFAWWSQDYLGRPDYPSLGYIAAFLQGDYDEPSMPLERSAWEQLRDSLADGAGDMDLETLNVLMTALVDRGLLSG